MRTRHRPRNVALYEEVARIAVARLAVRRALELKRLLPKTRQIAERHNVTPAWVRQLMLAHIEDLTRENSTKRSFHDEPATATLSKVERLIEEILDESRNRLHEPTTVPKPQPGRAPIKRPDTAIITRAAEAAIRKRSGA